MNEVINESHAKYSQSYIFIIGDYVSLLCAKVLTFLTDVN